MSEPARDRRSEVLAEALPLMKQATSLMAHAVSHARPEKAPFVKVL